MMRNWSLRLKIVFTTTVLVVATVAVILGLVSRIADGTARQVAKSARERTDLLLKRTLAEESSHLATVSELIATQPGTKSVLQADFATISDYLNTLSRQSGAGWLFIVDDQGRLRGRSDLAPVSTSTNFRSQRSVARGLQGKIWHGTEINDGKPDVRSAAPILMSGYLRGTVAVGRSVDAPFLEAIGSIAGVRLTTAESRESAMGQDDVGWTTEMRAGDDGAAIQVIAAFPSDTIAGSFRALRTGLAILLAGAVVVAIVLAMCIAFSVTKPLQALVAAAHELRQGNWPEPFRTKRRDEIGILQNAFDQMTHDLQDNYRRLESMLHVDPLTELLNHRAFRDRLEHEVLQARQIGYPMSLMLINLDNFEEFNRRHGARKADDLLKRFAGYLQKSAPDTAFLGRHGGDEFVLCTVGDQAEGLADGIRRGIQNELGITATLGCATLSEQIPTHDLLLLAAEMATRQAKVAGKNRVRHLADLPPMDSVDDLKLLLSEGSYPAVRALAEAVDAKDEYTRGHSQRVAEYARDLAEYCGYDEGFVELVFVTGTLHDVGKIGVPDSVLKKPAKLTDEEFELVKLHPALGEKIVSQLPQMAETLPGVRGHHERYDGRGYPDGICGEDIPLIARILAIADTYDAMTSDRPYRKGLSVDYALEEMLRGAGTQFDPVLAVKFVDLFRTRLGLNSEAA